jgi:uncharacterized glyoxalase superfamily protein PhnB
LRISDFGHDSYRDAISDIGFFDGQLYVRGLIKIEYWKFCKLQCYAKDHQFPDVYRPGGRGHELLCFINPEFGDRRSKKYGPNQGGSEGSVMRAKFTLHGQPFMCIDSPPVHAFTFTPSMSLYIDCESDDEIEKLYNALSEGGNILMPLGAYPFSKKYGWLSDKYGVSWQLNFNPQ